jgi:hypothetical protein
LRDTRLRSRSSEAQPKFAPATKRKIVWAAAGLFGILVIYFAATSWLDAPPRLYQVTGLVTVNGKPADLVAVCFWPTDMTTRRNFMYRNATGTTDGQGRFALKSGAGSEGIAAGEYKVTFSRPMVRGKAVTATIRKSSATGAVESIPVQFCEPEQTPLTATVSDKQRDFTFDVPLK